MFKTIITILIILVFSINSSHAKININNQFNDKKSFQAPIAKKIPDTLRIHGVQLIDNYSWLKDLTRTKKDVIDYVESENKYTDQKLSHTKKLQETLYNEFISRIKETDMAVPVKIDSFYYYSRKEKGEQYSFYCRKKENLDSTTQEEILINPNEMGKKYKYFSATRYRVSPNHRYFAFKVDTTGAENYFLKIKDLKTGKFLDEKISHVSGYIWDSDNKNIYYTTENDQQRSNKVFKHTLGTDVTEDNLIFEEKDEEFYVWLYKSLNNKFLFIGTASSTTSEIWFKKAGNSQKRFKIIEKREKGVEYYVDHHKKKDLYIHTNKDKSTNFKIMKADIDKTSKKYWQEYIKHNEKIYITSIILLNNHFVIKERENGLEKLKILNPLDKTSYYVNFPEPIYTYSINSRKNPNFNSNSIRFEYESLVTPSTVYSYDMNTKEKTLLKQNKVQGIYNPNDYKSERIFATTKDGSKVPISIVYKKNLFKNNGTNPLYLTSYGAYGSSSDIYFSRLRLSLLDRGVVYITAHIRGGSEMGKKWHDEGKMLNKKNTFTDFIACTEKLIEDKYSSPEKIVIDGGSAGGMLIGAVINMRPELYKAAIADVPFVDVINTMLDDKLPLTVGEYEEWGNPNIKKYFEYMLEYCPYQNIKKQNYPNILALAGFHDPRVNYWEPAKWVAKIRDMRTNNSLDKNKNLLLLKTNMSGHLGASGRYDFLKEVALTFSFALDMVGIKE